ncbi:MAG TPA: hypothetical protein VIM12_14020 [Noviherbaspirillum sp.]|jgi:hypothetical protein|uniref:hypothetical protein n=1 Tax=Noviherbaspirillum sp. TaxID=1926288 RepID=UPI002F93670D
MNKVMAPAHATDPEGPATSAAPAALTHLTVRLRALHKALLAVTRQRYEAEWGPVDNGGLLQLLTRHPDFRWLNALTVFMAEVDALRDRGSATDAEARGMIARARALFWPQGRQEAAFAVTYRSLLQDAPALVLEHASLKRLLEAG